MARILKSLLGFFPGAIKRLGGVRTLKLGGMVSMLGLAGDFMEPIVRWGLNWWGLGLSVAALVLGAIFVRGLLHNRDKAHQDDMVARVKGMSVIGIIVFGLVSVLNVAYGGSVSEQIPGVAALQDRLAGVEQTVEETKVIVEEIAKTTNQSSETLERIDQRGEETQKTVKKIEQNTSETADTLDRIDNRDELIATLALLDRVTEAKDLTDRGQVQMIEKLLASGHNFVGFDFAGVALDGLAVKGAKLNNIALSFSRLNDAAIIDSDLSEMTARFAEMRSSKFDGSNLTNSKFTYATAGDTSFRSAKATGASFYSSMLRGADLNGADLRGASFKFADLRDSRFDDANLGDTLLSGAILAGASLRGARFDNTDVTGTVIDFSVLTKSQRAGMCVRANPNGQGQIRVLVIEKIPSQRFSGASKISGSSISTPTFMISPTGICRPVSRAVCHPNGSVTGAASRCTTCILVSDLTPNWFRKRGAEAFSTRG